MILFYFIYKRKVIYINYLNIYITLFAKEFLIKKKIYSFIYKTIFGTIFIKQRNYRIIMIKNNVLNLYKKTIFSIPLKTFLLIT